MPKLEKKKHKKELADRAQLKEPQEDPNNVNDSQKRTRKKVDLQAKC